MLRALLLTTLSLSVSAGCVVDETGPYPADEDLGVIAAGTITPNRLLRDRDIEGADAATRAQIQAVLEQYGSALATYRHGGKRAAAWIHEASVAYDISPIYMIARIETESGLIRSGTLRHIDKATGCGCPDGRPCDPNRAGFDMQTLCAAEKMRGYLDDLDDSGQTISGWAVGRRKRTLDPCWVTPANRVTAALYTYTPWVGAYATRCGTSRWGGSSLVALLYHKFADAFAALPDRPDEPDEPGEPTTAIVIDSDAAHNDAAVARVSISASWFRSSYAPGYVGSGYAYASAQPIADAAVFEFYLDEPATMTVEAWWTAGSNRSAAAPFVIEDANRNRLDVVRVDQQTGGSQWNQLGSYRFSAGWNRILLSRWTSATGVVIADAVRVSPGTR